MRAKELLGQLSPYLLEAHTQSIKPSPCLRSIEPSPWEALTYNLSTAILAVGLRHPSLRDEAYKTLDGYLKNCLNICNTAPLPNTDNTDEDFVQLVGADRVFSIATLSTSLLGFLQAVTEYCQFYTVPQRIRLLTMLREAINEAFMTAIEGTFSSLRSSVDAPKSLHPWRSYTRRYAAAGRPLGAMSLQRGLMRVVLSCSSLQIINKAQLQKSDVLDELMSHPSFIEKERHHDSVFLTELITDMANQEMTLLEDGADYLQLGSVWQQRVAFATKAFTLKAYLACVIADEEVADPDTLLSWLEDIVTDSVQMTDNALAAAVLKSMAVISRSFPAFATNFSRLLPRFIVQGSVRGETVDVAARSLAYILQLLSQDAVITGLYSLGNVLSASDTNKAVGISGPPNGTLFANRTADRYEEQAAASSISLDLSGDEDTTAVYGNIVRAIVGVANNCHDDKITALALSILLQKLGRINMGVDVHIIREAARLVANGGSVELKSLLKFYVRIGHDGAVQKRDSLLTAVSHWLHSFFDWD